MVDHMAVQCRHLDSVVAHRFQNRVHFFTHMEHPFLPNEDLINLIACRASEPESHETRVNPNSSHHARHPPHTMMPIPSKATAAPPRSQAVRAIPSTFHNQSIATAT
jgi:hypothetical protein